MDANLLPSRIIYGDVEILFVVEVELVDPSVPCHRKTRVPVTVAVDGYDATV
jgi:hypothetical protein